MSERGLVALTVVEKRPPYSPEAGRKSGIMGSVLLRAVIRKNGEIDNIVVVKGLGDPDLGFNAAATEALSKWKFKPGTLEGVPVDVRWIGKVDFVTY